MSKLKNEEMKLIEQFLRSRRPNTERNYATALDQFYDHIAPKALINARAGNVATFLNHLRSKAAPDGTPLADETVRLRANAMRSICGYLVDTEYLPSNPFSIVRRLITGRQRAQKRPTALIPFELVNQMLELPDAATKNGKVDRAILAILFGGGMRRSEAHDLKLKDVQTDQTGIPFLALPHTKGGKSQRQPLPPWAWTAFARLVSMRKSDGAGPEDYMLVWYYLDGTPRGRITIHTLYRRYKAYAAMVGLTAAPHSARATAATMLAYVGWSEKRIAEFLRHSSTVQVDKYIKLATELKNNVGLTLFYPANNDQIIFNNGREFA